ncbi:MAG: helix-turn-helix domain-containing protein [Gaiella sp.]|nr:helix-turn-helix domain-containing protein [Gaiella sp.]
MADHTKRRNTRTAETELESCQLALFEVETLGQMGASDGAASTQRGTSRSRAPSRQRETTRSGHAAATEPAADSLLSPDDVARRCGLSRKAVYRAVGRGELRAARILSRLRIDPRDVNAWIRANVVEAHVHAPAPAPARLPAAIGLRRLLPGP